MAIGGLSHEDLAPFYKKIMMHKHCKQKYLVAKTRIQIFFIRIVLFVVMKFEVFSIL